MRVSDMFVLLMAAVMVLGASLAWATGAPAAVPVVLVVAAAGLALTASWRSSYAPRVALVGMRDGERLRALETALDDAGFVTRTCRGPQDHPCPVLDGRPCTVRGYPAAAIVYVPSGQTQPLPPCGRALDAPVLAVTEDPMAGPADDGSAMTLPWERGVDDVGDVVKRLLAKSDRISARVP